MSKERLFVIACLLGIAVSLFAQEQVSIAPFYGNRKAALTLTFDDGLQEHYTHVFPELKKRNMRATFAVIGSKVGGVMRSKQDWQNGTNGTPCMTWDMLREMAADGQEIASHGWEHKAMTRLNREELQREVNLNDSVIEAHTGIKPMTFVYPGNSKNDETIAFCEKGRVGSRLFQMSFGSKRSLPFLYAYVDSLIAQKKWGITMTHGITQGYDHFNNPQLLWHFMDYLQMRLSELWVATLRDVTAYVKERDNTQLKVKKRNFGFEINIKSTLDPELFSHPLTLVIDAPVGNAIQEGRQLTLVKKGRTTLVNINPNGGTIRIMSRQKHELPTMGWSSWNTYRVNISDSLIMSQADAMENKGLNTIRLYCDYAAMPDIDYMEVNKYVFLTQSGSVNCK